VEEAAGPVMRRTSATRLIVAMMALLVGAVSLTAPGTARAQSEDDWCLRTDPPEATEPAHPLRFGTTPLVAGNVGATQGEPVPFDPDRDLAGVVGLRPDGRELVMRLNRMFWADGEEGVRRYAEIVDRYAAAGFPSELQVRYHPPEGAEGDMEGWEAYVRMAARILGERPSLTALSITNEANMDISGNTSDGGYEGVREAIVVGTLAARDELDRMGRTDVQLGFSFAWRWLPNSDRGFWQELGERATPEFLAATDYVGLQIYPGLVWPPAPLPNRSAGREVNEALTLLRHCYLPMAGLEAVDLWVTENGYATNLGRDEATQDASLRSTIEEVHRLSGTLGVTDYRWFNLRDNRSDGPDLFDAVGLMRDDYSEKPAYGTFRELLAVYGTAPTAWPALPPAEATVPTADTESGDIGGDGDSPSAPPPVASTAALPATGGSTGLLPFGVMVLAAAAGIGRSGRGPRTGDQPPTDSCRATARRSMSAASWYSPRPTRSRSPR
jgi:hypothetical protein